MRYKLKLIVPVIALLLFLAVQFYMVSDIWHLKDEMMLMKYKTLSREALSLLASGKKENGFEKAMEINDKFTAMIIHDELPLVYSSTDTALVSKFRNMVLKQTTSVIEDGEKLTKFTKSYIKKEGYNIDFSTFIYIHYYALLTSNGKFVIHKDALSPKPSESSVVVNTFSEERNNFIIEYTYLIDLTYKNEMVFREALVSLALIAGSILMVLIVFFLSWRNLMEERRLSELKTDFINNMTHELKTPLSTITVAGRTLEKDQILNSRDKILETAHLIGKQSIHLNQLINTILEVSLLERTEFELNKQEIVIDELTHQIVSSFQTTCDGNAVIKEKYNCDGATVCLDVLYYTTVINNLLVNAVKYCYEKPLISITTEIDCRDVIVTVTDNGIGISKEHQEHIFEKFYRVPYGDIHKTKGLGLGLYYVSRIVAAHEGNVVVTSKPGKGTSFRIKLPM